MTLPIYGNLRTDLNRLRLGNTVWWWRNHDEFWCQRMTVEIPPELQDGINQFNQGEFYACHDTLEALWMEAPESIKGFYQGILQIAVALHHLSNCNWRGAVILLGEGISRLRPYTPDYAGVQVSDLIDQSTELLQALQQAGPEQVEHCAQHLGLIHRPNAPDAPRPNLEGGLSLQLPHISAACDR